MNNSDLKVLIVDKREEDALVFAERMRPEFDFALTDTAKSLHQAIQILIEEEYDLCFVADLFNEDETQSFLKDLNNIGKDQQMVLIQLRLDVAANVKRDSYKLHGFPCLISRKADQNDKTALEECIRELVKRKEIVKRVLNIEDAMRLALKEIDRVAETQKRGATSNYDLKKFPMQFMEMQTEFDQEVLMQYFKTLDSQTENSKANNVQHLFVPEEILKKRYFPGLNQASYTGASHRVWEKLKKKFGVDAENDSKFPLPNPELSSESFHELHKSKPKKARKLSAEERLSERMQALELKNEPNS
jgi:hypothetical protein